MHSIDCKPAYGMKRLKRISCTILTVVTVLLTAFILVQCLMLAMADNAKASDASFRNNPGVHQNLDRIMSHAYPKLHPAKREKYRKSIIRWSEKYDLCPVTVAAIIWKESKFDEKCRYLGALGPMQTIPRYHRDRMAKAGISVADISTIDKGVQIGCIVFRHYMDKSKGNVSKALKYYNGCVNAKNPKYVRDVIGMRNGSLKQLRKKDG